MTKEGNIPYSEGEETEGRRPHKGGRILILEPTNTKDLLVSPMVVTSFKHVGFFEFCEKIQKVQHHAMLTIIFVSNLHENQVTLVVVTFTVSLPSFQLPQGSQMLGRNGSNRKTWRSITMILSSNLGTRMR